MSAACHAVGCSASRGRNFMCRPHWFALPIPLRRQINATWRAYRESEADDSRGLFLEYIEACDEARRWTAEGEGKLAEFTPDAPRLRRLRELRA